MPCPSPVGDLRSPKWRATRYARPFSLRRRTWVEANLFIRSFLPGGNTYRTFRAPFVKRVAGRTLTAHSNVLRIYVARFPAFPLPLPGLATAVTTFPSPFKLTTHSPLPTFLSGHPGLPRGIPPLRWSLSTSPFCKETDFSTPSLTPGVVGGGGGGGWVVVGCPGVSPRRWSANYLLTPYVAHLREGEYLLGAAHVVVYRLVHAVLVRPRDEARASLRSISACQYAHAFSAIRDTCAPRSLVKEWYSWYHPREYREFRLPDECLKDRRRCRLR